MAAMNRRKKGLLGKFAYTLILISYGALIAFVGVTWLSRVSDYAEQYELSRPAKAVDAYLETVNRDQWNDGIARAVAAMPHEMQSDEEIRAFVQDKLKAGVTAVRKSGANEQQGLSYSLRCDGREIGGMTIVEDTGYRGKVDQSQMPWPLVKKFLPGILEWGITPWVLSEDHYDFTNLYNSVEITVPASYSVSINGVALDESYIIEDGIHYDIYEQYYDLLPELPTKVTYRYDNAIGAVTTEIRDEAGNPVQIDENAGDYQFITPPDPATRERLMALMEPFTRNYLIFRSGAGDSMTALNNLKPYIVPGSDIDKRAQAALDGLGWAHTSSVQITDYSFQYALPLINGLYDCHVNAVADTYTYGKGEVTDSIDLSVIVYDDGYQALAIVVN